jgi:hypothetical protein
MEHAIHLHQYNSNVALGVDGGAIWYMGSEGGIIHKNVSQMVEQRAMSLMAQLEDPSKIMPSPPQSILVMCVGYSTF